MNKVKNVLVTGGLGGIGLNICKLFIKKNHNLVIVDNIPKKYFSKRLSDQLITNKKNTILYKKIDLTKTSQIKNLFQQLKRKFSSIDILINCAGIQHISSVENFGGTCGGTKVNMTVLCNYFIIKITHNSK